ncbi:30S ribosomal protein S15 [Coxiella endosymbiont of Amblyomma americanum]|uniref:30S ribosomal protein S15 n=1 Tax=Coxiella endosymbiont of Amblyomma americanum TaxID=325775 RepID=UPI00057FB279|nr:30S ribosomal protein S15 [Coxiella endosymbiont of Amblyomma americanum]AJC50550.1 30S ribosomal protein S15 [Coxiella endosymbiont of Amblyomma americanum]AUJ58885.1 30S ribosomal protein S15 [Coxiella-like endosymbiont of Amblyomma americanum]
MSLTSKETAIILEKYQRDKRDTGSSEVQVAILSAKIAQLTEHFKSHKKDHHSRQGLLRAINQRRKMLNYLKNNDVERYYRLVEQLKLRS